MPAADPLRVRFFPGARLNAAETFLKNAGRREAIVFIGGPGVVADRLSQTAPRLMFAADGCVYGGRRFETRAAIAEVAARVPPIRQVVV